LRGRSGESRYGDAKSIAGRNPGLVIGRHPATWNQAMDVGMIDHGSGPGVEYGKETDHAPHKAGIFGGLHER
jgi:hypothetical protein